MNASIDALQVAAEAAEARGDRSAAMEAWRLYDAQVLAASGPQVGFDRQLALCRGGGRFMAAARAVVTPGPAQAPAA